MAVMTLKAAFLNLLFIAVTKAAEQTEESPTNTASSGDTREKHGISKNMVAVVIGVGLTTFITVFVSFYLVRGYKNLQHTASVDLETTEEEVLESTNHVSARENLGSNVVEG